MTTSSFEAAKRGLFYAVQLWRCSLKVADSLLCDRIEMMVSEHRKEYMRVWRLRNRDRCRASFRRWYAKNNAEETEGYYARNRATYAKRARDYIHRYPERYKAKQAVNHALRSGRLRKPSRCSECGRRRHPIEAHHSDYSKPLEVTWLCKPCHGLTRRSEA